MSGILLAKFAAYYMLVYSLVALIYHVIKMRRTSIAPKHLVLDGIICFLYIIGIWTGLYLVLALSNLSYGKQ